MRAQVNFNFARIEKNGGLRIFILAINRRDLFVDCRLAHARHAQHTRSKTHLTSQFFQPRQHMIFEHRFHFPRRPGKQSDCTTFMFEIEPGRSPVRIGQHFGAVDHHRLA